MSGRQSTGQIEVPIVDRAGGDTALRSSFSVFSFQVLPFERLFRLLLLSLMNEAAPAKNARIILQLALVILLYSGCHSRNHTYDSKVKAFSMFFRQLDSVVWNKLSGLLQSARCLLPSHSQRDLFSGA